MPRKAPANVALAAANQKTVARLAKSAAAAAASATVAGKRITGFSTAPAAGRVASPNKKGR
jgi:hypothetical protein